MLPYPTDTSVVSLSQFVLVKEDSPNLFHCSFNPTSGRFLPSGNKVIVSNASFGKLHTPMAQLLKALVLFLAISSVVSCRARTKESSDSAETTRRRSTTTTTTTTTPTTPTPTTTTPVSTTTTPLSTTTTTIPATTTSTNSPCDGYKCAPADTCHMITPNCVTCTPVPYCLPPTCNTVCPKCASNEKCILFTNATICPRAPCCPSPTCVPL
ncbi:hypothetical protein RB195_006492 [Necator americanus]|uniref:Uncharacterized protein n=1 Tax=Necator americanus TaxID=51031 RepID=A0ABR1BVU8_NECAM